MGSLLVGVKKVVRDSLRDRLGLEPDFNGQTKAEWKVDVSYAYRFNASRPQREQVYLGKATADTPPTGNRAGANVRRETGHVDLTVLVLLGEGDAEDVEDRLQSICDQVEDWFDLHKNGSDSGLDIAGGHVTELTLRSWRGGVIRVADKYAAARTYSVQWAGRLREATS